MKQLLFLFTAILALTFAYSQPGTVDASFGTKGFVYDTGLSVHYAVVQQPDGKLLTAGGYNKADFTPLGNVARFLQDGTLDSTFGTNGYADYPSVGVYDMILQPDGKIVTVGSSVDESAQSVVARLQPNGTLDSTFGENGISLLPTFGTNTDVYGDIRQENRWQLYPGRLWNYANQFRCVLLHHLPRVCRWHF